MDPANPYPPPPSPPAWIAAFDHARAMLLSGFLILLPIAVCFFVVRFLFNIIGVFVDPMVRVLPPETPALLKQFLPTAVFVLIIYLTGLIGHRVVGRKVISLVDAIFLKIPGIKVVYGASKQLVDSLSSMGAKSTFKSVVIVDCFFPGFKGVGFLTGSIRDTNGKLFYKVFLPTAPNPTSGFLLVIPREKVYISSMDVEEAFKIIVSGGMLSSDTMDLEPKVIENGKQP